MTSASVLKEVNGDRELEHEEADLDSRRVLAAAHGCRELTEAWSATMQQASNLHPVEVAFYNMICQAEVCGWQQLFGPRATDNKPTTILVQNVHRVKS